jgi:2-succinyl-5-enolpyruvyl-6-hydroxy-3-cyclohexene-1-carboxylate synthase
MESTENLTLNRKIIKPHTADALEGHTVVVLERCGTAGETFRYQLKPGQLPPKPRLSLRELFRGENGGPGFVAFAVTDNAELRTSVTTPVVMDDQKRSFSVTVQASFRASDPRLVVARRDDDPVQQIHQEMSVVVARELSQRDWGEVRHNFRALQEEVVSDALAPLRRFAATYGFWIEALSLTCHLSEQDARLIEQEAAAELATEQQKVQLKQVITLRPLQETVNAQERQDKVFAAAAEAAAAAIRNVPQSIHTVAELAKGIETFARYANGGDFTRQLLEDSTASAEGMSGAGGLIADMLITTEKLAHTVARKRQTQSAALHLIAELLLEEADEVSVNRHRDRVQTLFASNGADDAEKLDRFANIQWLRSQLC